MKLKFAYKAKSIEYVYKIGPSSCMKGSKRVRAYEGPDLAVAYIRDKKQIVARSVVWPAKKQYYTIYAKPQDCKYELRASYFGGTYYNVTRVGKDYFKMMKRLLNEAGYKKKRLAGARLSKIPAKKRGPGYYQGFIVPSVDGRKGFEVGRNYITIK